MKKLDAVDGDFTATGAAEQQGGVMVGEASLCAGSAGAGCVPRLGRTEANLCHLEEFSDLYLAIITRNKRKIQKYMY